MEGSSNFKDQLFEMMQKAFNDTLKNVISGIAPGGGGQSLPQGSHAFKM